MAKDNANIYKLSDKDFKKEKANSWANSIVGAEDIARMLKEEILHEETPFVLSVNASYGMGKTYFFSRFCEYLKDNNVPSVYISAWENDYAPSPYLYLFGEIFKYLKSKLPEKSGLDKLKEKATILGKKLLLKTFAYPNVDLDDLCSTFFEADDIVKEFRAELADKFNEANKKQKNDNPLVFIIDELDKCRPDYVLKTIEIMKHFFDIENLVFVLPIRKSDIENAIIAVFGYLTEINEVYCKKLIDKELELPKPEQESYVKLVQLIITKDKLAEAMKKGLVSDDKYFNNFNRIAEILGNYAFELKLTFRETVKLCETFILIANNANRNLNVEYICYKLCSSLGKKGDIKLSDENPLGDFNNEQSGKRIALTIKGVSKVSLKLRTYYDGCVDCICLYAPDDTFPSYNELDELLRKIKETDDNPGNKPDAFYELKDVINTALVDIRAYQDKHGSSSADEENKEYFDKIIESNLMLFE